MNRFSLNEKRNLLLYGAIYVGIFLGHLFYTVGVDGICILSDSGVYYVFSRLPLTDSQFWGSARPPVILFFYKLFGGYDYGSWDWTWSNIYVDDATLLYGQTFVSIAAFSFLAVACAKTARTSKGRLILFAFPLLFSLTPLVAKWNLVALSESFTFSLFAVFVALWIFYFLTKRPSWLVGIAIVALLWGGVRDTNAYLLIMIAGVIMIVTIAGVLRKNEVGRRATRVSLVPLTALCIWFGGVFALSNFSSERGDRWVFPFYNSVGQRILPVPEYVSYFADHGMPISPALLERTGKWASDDDSAFYSDPRLEEFRVWTANHGKMTYIKFLMSHLVYSVTAPGLDFQKNFLNEVAYVVYFHPAIPPPIPLVMPPRLSVAMLYLLLVSYGVTALLTFILYWRRWLHESPYLAVPLVMVLLSVPHAWLAYHGDPMEIVRHSLTAVIQFLLGFVLLWLNIMDAKTHRHSIRQAEQDT